MLRGQAAVEFAIIAVVALIVLLVGIQFAMLGQAALAVSQASDAIARFAAVNPGQLGPNGTVPLNSTIEQLVSSTLLSNGGNDLTISIASFSQNTTTTTSSPTMGDRAVVSISYNASSKIILPNPFLSIPFPSNLTANEVEMYE